MSNSFRAMRRIGTSGNYLRISDANEHLLANSKMTEVEVTNIDGKLVETNTPQRDYLASKDLARVIGEILNLDSKRQTLVAHAAGLLGGPDALKSAGIALPEQTIHDTPATRATANNAKQAEKRAVGKEKQRQARNRKRQESKPNKTTPAPVAAPKHVGVQLTEDDI